MIRNACCLTNRLLGNHTENVLFSLGPLQCFTISHKWLSDSTTNIPPTQKRSRLKPQDSESTELVPVDPKEIFVKEFPDFFQEGKIVNRISYIDFIDQALEKLKELGLEKDLNAYKELLKVFPPGKYHPKSSWDIGMFHAPQQLCAARILFTMELNLVKPDKEVERIVIDAFSIHSDVWKKVARMNYWTMKARHLDPYPVPQKIPKEPHQIAKIAITRMLDDPETVISVRNTSSLPDVVDKTWVVYSQSPLQQSIIERLDKETILYIEHFGNTYVTDKFLSYFVLKVYDDAETLARRRKLKPEKHYNYNALNMRFYGKPIQDKLLELESVYEVDDGQVLAIGITGTSSDDSALSWLKLLQQRNPNLKNLNVVFRLDRLTHEVIDPNNPDPIKESPK